MMNTRFTPYSCILLAATILSASVAAQEVPVPSANATAAIADSTPNFLVTVIEKLAPENRKEFAAMLSSDWQDRPEWAEMMITMLAGTEMGPGAGWYQPSQKKHDWEWFYAKFDINQDGHVARDELSIDAPYAEWLFPRLDRDNDGQLQSADFDYFTRQQPTPPQMLSQLLSSVLDVDSNGRIS